MRLRCFALPESFPGQPPSLYLMLEVLDVIETSLAEL